jgi:hypothetical protein
MPFPFIIEFTHFHGRWNKETSTNPSRPLREACEWQAEPLRITMRFVTT